MNEDADIVNAMAVNGSMIRFVKHYSARTLESYTAICSALSDH